MRTLIILRGAPGCGKSTWIEDHRLLPYTVSADDIRQLYASPTLGSDGKVSISQQNDNVVWDTLFQMLETRMTNGDFTVIDACNSKTSEMARYRKLADDYRYRIYCVDFTDVPIDVVKERNARREPLKRVPDAIIDRMYARFATQTIPSGIQRITPNELPKVFTTPFNMNRYRKIVHIGDIHGCYDKLIEAVPVIEEDVGYIFMGDYADRGPDSAKVIQYLLDIYKKPNVCILEGNHERHLWEWANGRQAKSKEFEYNTRRQLEAAGIDKKAVRDLYRHMRQCSYYIYYGELVLCTHGGIANWDGLISLDFVSTRQMINGCGGYYDADACISTMKNSPVTQVFGHRMFADHGYVDADGKGYSIDGHVERGGELRVLTLENGEFTMASYKNPLPETPPAEFTPSEEAVTIHELVAKMRSTKLIQEKKFGHISSFNFTRDAFADKKWNDLTTKARGLFIDTLNDRIVARGYDKFFAIGERYDTKFQSLESRLVFPVHIYIKSNGFLGMASWDNATGTLFTATKSTPEGVYADLFRSMLTREQKEVLSEYLSEHPVTLLFEVIDPGNDPHIVTYDKPDLVLLDAVTNTLDAEFLPYDELAAIAARLNVTPKGKYIPSTVDTMTGFIAAADEVTGIDTDSIEGVVFRDSNGLMLKCKTAFYTRWKKLRYVAQTVLKQGYITNTQILTDPLDNYFYAWVKQYKNDGGTYTNIIELRNKFFQAHPEYNDASIEEDDTIDEE